MKLIKTTKSQQKNIVYIVQMSRQIIPMKNRQYRVCMHLTGLFNQASPKATMLKIRVSFYKQESFFFFWTK